MTMAHPMSYDSLELSHYCCSHLTLQSGRRWQPFATAGVGNDVLRHLPESRATATFCGTSFLLYNAFGIFRLRPPHTNFFVRSASLHYYLAISLQHAGNTTWLYMAAPFGFSTLCPALRQLFFNLMVVHTYMQHFLTFLSYLAPCSQPLEKNSSGHHSESDVMHNC